MKKNLKLEECTNNCVQEILTTVLNALVPSSVLGGGEPKLLPTSDLVLGASRLMSSMG